VVEDLLQTAVRKASRRLVWFLMLLYFFAVLDRVNVGIAAITMRADLHLSAAAFGLGAGVFFLGYLVFEIPSNLLLTRFGARLWLSRIAITWGLAAMAVALAWDDVSFIVLRFLLGLAEAGFFPGVVFTLALWFPVRHRARITAHFLIAVPLSNALAAALSSPILALQGTLGLAGWQWLFILEGAPTVMLGVLALFVLADGPSYVRWLHPDEKRALAAALASQAPTAAASVRAALLSPLVWLLGLAYFGVNISLTALGMWLPQLVHGLGHFSAIGSGLLSSGILLPGALAMVLWSRHSDISGERARHVIVAAILAATGWVVSAFAATPAVAFAALALAAAGTYMTLSLFWTLPMAFLSGRAGAAGIALIGSVGGVGGFLGPWAIGALRDATGDFSAAFALLAAAMLVTAAIAWRFGRTLLRPATAPV
jgi:MFS family permease